MGPHSCNSGGKSQRTIVVPARNEEESIRQALSQLLALDYDNYEVIAVDDRSTDRTGEIMDKLAIEGATAFAVKCEAPDCAYHRTSRRLARQSPRHVERR